MESIWQDIRYGARMLWKHRLATLICAVALSLGIGANTAMFSSAEGLLLRPVAFADADRVVALVDIRPQQNGLMQPIAPATFMEWKEQAKSFEELSASNWYSVNFTGDREPEKVQGFLITANYFSVLGVQPQLGRPFLPEEEKPGKEQEVILSHGLWERRYAANPDILGKTVKVDGKSFTIVGVMGKGFDFPMSAEAWMPMAFNDAQMAERAHRELSVLGRLKPQVTGPQAAAEMQAIAQRQAEAFPDNYKGWQLRVMSLREYASGDLTRQFTLLLLGATGFVLLIACADVANVQFARVTGRHKELAVRTALGASRSRIVRQLLIESVMLSLIGAVFGLALAKWGLTLMIANMPPDVAKYVAGWKTIGLDAGAFFFTLTIAFISGILSGIMPSLFTSRGNVGEVLKESGRGSSAGRARHRLRGALVVAEIAMALVLLVGAGLLVKGFRALLTVNQNYHPESLLTLNLDLPELQYKQQPLRAAFHQQFLQRLAGIPGVQSAALVSHLPYSRGGLIGSSPFSISGRPSPAPSDIPSAILENVSPNYFSLMNIGLRDGRTLTESDAATTQPVAVVSRSLAERYFPGDNPLGRKLQVGDASSAAPLLTVVGIVDDVHYNWIEKDAVPTLYTSYRQTPPLYASFVLRVPGDPESFASAVHAQLLTVDPDLPMYNVKSQDRAITESIVGIEHVAVMMGIVGVIALVLASVGVYGVMSYSVSERTNEIGIRMAMGAKADDILRLVVGNGMILTLLGIAIGMPLAFGLAKTLSSILFGVTAADPFAFIGLPLILAAVATLASYLPARRALRVDPLIALRYE
ncbi:MAG TPA: ABC transporter permease [Candidatus Saccharimonadales bacterium]|nr:ABC transporter permease [Candidatus Saccharimonadales bacterium]